MKMRAAIVWIGVLPVLNTTRHNKTTISNLADYVSRLNSLVFLDKNFRAMSEHRFIHPTIRLKIRWLKIRKQINLIAADFIICLKKYAAYFAIIRGDDWCAVGLKNIYSGMSGHSDCLKIKLFVFAKPLRNRT